MKKPKIGDIVIYNPTLAEKEQMQKDSDAGLGMNVQDRLPAVVVAVWGSECVNLKVITDGNKDLWVTSALRGEVPRGWEEIVNDVE